MRSTETYCKAWVGSMAMVALLACDEPTRTSDSTTPSAKSAPAASGEGRRAQVRIGGDAHSKQPSLAFRIDQVHTNRKLATAAPWHAEGGDWTFCDAALEADPKTQFSFGIQYTVQPGSHFAFGDAFLAVPDSEHGGRLLAAFAKAFRTKTGPKPAATGPLHLKVAAAILAEKVARSSAGSFGGKGSWVATKLFPEANGIGGELFFNYDTVTKAGEFSEKDSSYNQDVAKIFSRALR